MEFTDMLFWMIVLLIAVVVIWRVILAIERILTVKHRAILEKSRKMSDVRNAGTEKKRAPPAPAQQLEEVGAWLPELLEGFGIDPDVIFDDEMPPELKTFLPFIKSYVNSQGGLPGIMQGLQARAGAGPDEREII